MMGATKRKRRQPKPEGLADHAPLRHQQLHKVAPTEPVTVKVRRATMTLNGKPVLVDEEVVRTVRRQVDARLWDRFDVEQEAAAMQIYGAWRAVTMGVGMRISDPGRTPGSGNAADAVDFNHALRATWFRWVVACQNAGVSWQAATEILCHGLTAREVDVKRARRNGWSITELLDALDQWCLLRHWKQDGRQRPCT